MQDAPELPLGVVEMRRPGGAFAIFFPTEQKITVAPGGSRDIAGHISWDP